MSTGFPTSSAQADHARVVGERRVGGGRVMGEVGSETRPSPIWREPVKGGDAGHLGGTMNVSEATATNLLLGVVLGMSGVGAVPVSDEDAERAAQFLANRAGSDGALDCEAVAARWAR